MQLFIATIFCCCVFVATHGQARTKELHQASHLLKKTLQSKTRDVYRLENAELTLAKTMSEMMSEGNGELSPAHQQQMRRIAARLRAVHTELEQTKDVRDILKQKFLRRYGGIDPNARKVPAWLRKGSDMHAISTDLLFFLLGMLLMIGTLLFRIVLSVCEKAFEYNIEWIVSPRIQHRPSRPAQPQGVVEADMARLPDKDGARQRLVTSDISSTNAERYHAAVLGGAGSAALSTEEDIVLLAPPSVY